MSRWNFIKRNKVTSIFVLVLVLGGIVGTIFGVAQSNGCGGYKDNTLIERNGHEIKWDKKDLPVPVIVIDQSLSPSAFKAAYEAINYINSIANHPIFLMATNVVGDHEGQAAVMLVPYKGEKQNKGITQHALSKEEPWRIVSALVTLPDTGNQRANYKIAVHEFLHVLGLAHDEIETSIMFPRLLNHKNQDITYKDQELIKEL